MASRLVVLALFVLAGCAGSPPLYVHTETGRSYGYSETQLSNTQYRVAYRAPRVSTRTPNRIERERRGHERLALAYDLALWRAADVALQLGVPGFAVASRENDVQVEVSLDKPYQNTSNRSLMIQGERDERRQILRGKNALGARPRGLG